MIFGVVCLFVVVVTNGLKANCQGCDSKYTLQAEHFWPICPLCLTLPIFMTDSIGFSEEHRKQGCKHTELHTANIHKPCVAALENTTPS